MADCLIALGANLGDRAAMLRQATEMLRADPATRTLAASRFHETPAVGGPREQGAFLNAAVRIETGRTADDLFSLLVDIERQLGRRRDVRWGPRTIDLDLLLYGEEIIETPHVNIPHPRMAFRRFVLAPAAEVAGEMVHPEIGWKVGRLLAHLDEADDYIALAGAIGVGKSRLAAELAARNGWRLTAETPPGEQLGRYYADPAREAWRTENVILQQRRRMLDRATWPAERLAIGDFWFGQSLPFARLWMNDEAYAAFENEWNAAADGVVRPKLIVWLDAPSDVLAARVRQRASPYEASLDAAALGTIRDALAQHINRPGHGPILKLEATDDGHLAEEIEAAVKAMA